MPIYNKVGFFILKDVCGKQQSLLKDCVRCMYMFSSYNDKQFVLRKVQLNSYPTNRIDCKGQLQLSFPFTVYRQYTNKVDDKTHQELSNSEKLKKAVKEYGSTVIVFHIGISLLSLGFFYVLVSSGVDLTILLQQIGFSDEKISKLAGNTGTFVVAYAIHKIFAPMRIGITLTATPFIVRHLRNIGWLKK